MGLVFAANFRDSQPSAFIIKNPYSVLLMERMMTVLVVLILFLLAFVTVLSSDLDRPPILAYELRDANDSEVNGR